MRVRLFIAEEQTLDKRRLLEFEVGTHFLHVDDRLVFVEFEGDGQFLQQFEALLPVRDGNLFHC